MTAVATPRKEGDRVSVDHPKHPGVWIVKSVGPVNTTLEPVGGGHRHLRVPHEMLIDPDTRPVIRPKVSYVPGELVRVDGRYAKRYPGLYVVLADKDGDKVNIAKVGGDSGNYLRAMRGGLVKVNPEDVLIVQTGVEQ